MQGEQFQVFIWKVHRGIYVSGKEGAKDLAAMKKLGISPAKLPFLPQAFVHTRVIMHVQNSSSSDLTPPPDSST